MTTERKINVKVPPDEQSTLEHIKTEIDRGIEFMNSGQFDRSILIFKQLVPKANVNPATFDILQHNLLTAYKRRVEQLLAIEDVTPVNRYLPEIFELTLKGDLSRDPEFRGGFADVFRQLGVVFYEKRQHIAALACFRKAIAIQPCPSYYVDVTNALAFTKERAQLKDYTQNYSQSDLGRHIFITCAPKSGSTFLKNVLIGITGFRDLFTVYAALQNEHEIDMPQLAKFGNINTVTQQHARASEANIQLMQAFRITPVVLVRNIFDTVVSLLDFYRRGFTFSTFFDRDEFLAFGEEQQIDLLIEYVIPWYFQFVASWLRAERDNRLEVHWLTYEGMIMDKIGTVANILTNHGISAPKSEIEKQIAVVEGNRDRNRINKGVSGRGDSVLSLSQKKRIVRLGRHFPKADFGCLGL
ncbi:MAG: sulfotransferase domain-containing protein [Chloracidobacterium sp.]|nr:sulfotransferase domain-containing protein [Chloracidobacterium sp.]